MQTPLQLDIWLQKYEGFDNAKNNVKQRNLNIVFANISYSSDSYLLSLDHVTYNINMIWMEQDVHL